MVGLLLDFALLRGFDRLRQCKRKGCSNCVEPGRRNDKEFCTGCSQPVWRQKKLEKSPLADKMEEWRDREFPNRKRWKGRQRDRKSPLKQR
jgi:hypothetical protein